MREEAIQEGVETPIIFLIFNRPEVTAKVFQKIRESKPKKLFIVADGPRKGAEKLLCQQTRAITELIDWGGEVYRNYSDINLGCRKRVSSGIAWAFEHVEEAIILEDDCLPDLTFFRYCEELLDVYRDDTRIMAISGNNFQFGRQVNNYSYYFSKYNHCWGWATWQRAWKMFDVEMKLWPQIRDNGKLRNVLDTENEIRYWTKIFDLASSNVINSWAYRWTFACWMQNGLTILPNQNLVSNVGFVSDATHTSEKISQLSHMPTHPMSFPLKHPPYVFPEKMADQATNDLIFAFPLYKRAYLKFKKLVSNVLSR